MVLIRIDEESIPLTASTDTTIDNREERCVW